MHYRQEKPRKTSDFCHILVVEGGLYEKDPSNYFVGMMP